jgi:hypothetical protein
VHAAQATHATHAVPAVPCCPLQDREEGVDEGDERGIADLLLDQVGGTRILPTCGAWGGVSYSAPRAWMVYPILRAAPGVVFANYVIRCLPQLPLNVVGALTSVAVGRCTPRPPHSLARIL